MAACRLGRGNPSHRTGWYLSATGLMAASWWLFTTLLGGPIGTVGWLGVSMSSGILVAVATGLISPPQQKRSARRRQHIGTLARAPRLKSGYGNTGN